MIPEGFLPLLTKEQIADRVTEMAAELAAEYFDRPTTFVGVLDGALFFLTDLIRATGMDVQVDFLRLTCYHGRESSRDLHFLSGLTWNVSERHIVLIDDILDSGKTLSFCIEHMRAQGAQSVACAVLLAKERRREYPVDKPYIGFTIPDRFVIGYGLDWDGRYRHLPEIYYREKQA